jgi:hypothetical protein
MLTQNQEAARAFVIANNDEGQMEHTLTNIDSDRYADFGIIQFDNQRALELLKDNNILGRFNDIIALCELVAARGPTLFFDERKDS